MPVTIQMRRGTAAQWTTADPVLASGEPGLETDTGRMKVGDGSTGWTGLAYASEASTYTHTQAVPEASWSIVHSLGHRPSVTVIDSAGESVMGKVTYVSLDEVTVDFSAALSGSAVLR